MTADPCRRKSRNDAESKAAFDSLGDHRRELLAKVYRLIREAGETGATLEDACKALKKPKCAVSGRISELRHKLGAIYATGELRKTKSGRSQKVYRSRPVPKRGAKARAAAAN